MIRKQFSNTLYKRNNSRGINAALYYLNAKETYGGSCRYVENNHTYGPDILGIKGGKVLYCWEVEVRETVWVNDGPFPFQTVHVIERKGHWWTDSHRDLENKMFYTLSNDYTIGCIQVSNDLKRALRLNGNVISQYNAIPNPNKFEFGEYAMDIPTEKWEAIDLI